LRRIHKNDATVNATSNTAITAPTATITMQQTNLKLLRKKSVLDNDYPLMTWSSVQRLLRLPAKYSTSKWFYVYFWQWYKYHIAWMSIAYYGHRTHSRELYCGSTTGWQ